MSKLRHLSNPVKRITVMIFIISLSFLVSEYFSWGDKYNTAIAQTCLTVGSASCRQYAPVCQKKALNHFTCNSDEYVAAVTLMQGGGSHDIKCNGSKVTCCKFF